MNSKITLLFEPLGGMGLRLRVPGPAHIRQRAPASGSADVDMSTHLLDL